ncbi:MAG TPA: ribonuclease Z, partial [Acidobacteriota bacterium]|nr:ribonuclease Z [Acidobacteriota bacterium]
FFHGIHGITAILLSWPAAVSATDGSVCICSRIMDNRIMRVQFIGVGEAFDETLANNSQLLMWPDCRLLIDCGYAVPHSFWKLHPDPNLLDTVYISHAHADHYFGLPSCIVRMAEDGRRRDLEVLCPQGLKATVVEMIELAYPGLMPKLPFLTTFREVEPGVSIPYRGAVLEFAPSAHPVKNFAIAVTVSGKKYAYSGDGSFTEQTRRLYSNCRLLVHEAYEFETEKFGHACIANLLRMAEEQKVQVLALTHLQRTLRKTRAQEIREFAAKSAVKVMIPEVGDVVEVE